MGVRAANFVDIPRVASLMEAAHERSIYAQTATFDAVEAKQLCARAMQRHGHKNYGGMLFLVAEKDGGIEGFLIGLVDQVYPCLKELIVTDLLFIFSERADPRDAKKIVAALVAWGEENPKVIEIRLGVTGGISDWQRTAKLYERLGFEQYGALFKKDLPR